MLKCNLPTILDERKMRISDLARDTGIHRNTISRVYNETVTRIELDVVESICASLDITVGDLYEMPPLISINSENRNAHELLNAIENTQERLIVLSPYISTEVVTTEFLDKLKSCLDRVGVVYLIYGNISDNINGALEAHKQLKFLAEEKTNLNIIVTNQFAKMVIVDNKYVLKGRYSYLAQPIWASDNAEEELDGVSCGADAVEACVSNISDILNISFIPSYSNEKV